MKSVNQYLGTFQEEMPAWLKSYKTGDKVGFADFMSGRVGYYPGSGQDGNLVTVGSRSQSVHCFLYVDYNTRKAALQELLAKEGTFSGYHSIGRVEWQESDLVPNGQYPLPQSFEYRSRQDPMFGVLKSETPYVFMEIFERDANKDERWGAERFAVSFLFADGIATYYQLFVKEYKKAPWLFLLQDHGFGGNYDSFGKNGLLDAIMKDSGVRPEYVICAESGTKVWEGYELVPDVAPTLREVNQCKRYLYAKK